uniref:Uncharacterized protein n=1 Tax=Chenopodium quinoa TaxID=63459 RepID=A0A803KUD4_CHEQI
MPIKKERMKKKRLQLQARKATQNHFSLYEESQISFGQFDYQHEHEHEHDHQKPRVAAAFQQFTAESAKALFLLQAGLTQQLQVQHYLTQPMLLLEADIVATSVQPAITV